MTEAKGAALVTGGATRVGKALCETLSRNGFHVVIHYRNSAVAAEKLAADIESNGGKASLVSADLQNRSQLNQLISEARAQTGPLSLLVNSASAFEDDSILDFSDESWDMHLDMHLRAPMRLIQDFARQVSPEFNNLVVNIIDQRVWALTPKFFSYTLSKAALWTATQTVAQALGPKKIRVNAIGPGPTLKNKRQSEADWQKQNEATILGHGASPDDIAAALMYLMDAKAVTGQMIAVDGGQHLAWETPDVIVNE